MNNVAHIKPVTSKSKTELALAELEDEETMIPEGRSEAALVLLANASGQCRLGGKPDAILGLVSAASLVVEVVARALEQEGEEHDDRDQLARSELLRCAMNKLNAVYELVARLRHPEIMEEE